MVTTRDKHIPAIYADNAETVIPDEPVQGVAYRDENLENAVINQGLPFAKVLESADFNQFIYIMSSVLQMVDRQGILGWSDDVPYGLNAVVRGSDGKFYVSNSVNGPGQGEGIRDPAISANVPEYWETLANRLGVGNITINLGVERATDKVTIKNPAGSDAPIPAATPTRAGVQTSADKAKLNSVEQGAQVNVGTNLAVQRSSDAVSVNSSTGANDVILGATQNFAGVLSATDKTKLDNLSTGGGAGPTHISVDQTSDDVIVNSSTGGGDVIPSATQALAGVLSAPDKVKLDNIPAFGGTVNLGFSPSQNDYVISSSRGSNTRVLAASDTKAGAFPAPAKIKLDTIEAGAQVNVGTNIGITRSATNVTVNPSTGQSDTIERATQSTAGVMSAADKRKLDELGALKFVPVGSIIDFAGTEAPLTWLICNGAEYLRSLYPALFALIGTTFGGGLNTFRVPDCRALVTRGWDNRSSGNGDPNRAFGSIQQDSFRSHRHIIEEHRHSIQPHSHQILRVAVRSSGGWGYEGANAADTRTHQTEEGGTPYTDYGGTERTNYTGAAETRMKNIAFNKIIKT